MKGKRTFMTLFGPEVVAEGEEQQEDQRGRDPELITQRNRHLLYRLAWYQKTYEAREYWWYLGQLRKEFYLSESTIGQIVAADTEVLPKIKRDGLPGTGELRKMFAWW
jgi:hypothetical protein